MVFEPVDRISYPGTWMAKRIYKAIGCLIFAMCGMATGKLNLQWPTEHPPLDMRDSFYALLQPTESNEIQSGNFGCVRSEGTQFHEAIDLKSFSRDARGESTDAVLSILPGRVVYAHGQPNKSTFGRYVVIEHSDGEISFFSLYAHLRSIERGIGRGSPVVAGQKIATMGRSASYPIPRSRAHLHFEVGLLLTDRFQNWYDWKEFPTTNLHGIYNGINLKGIDPAAFFEELQWGKGQGFRSVLENQATAFSIAVGTRQVPDFLRRYPTLLNGSIPRIGLAGWKIDFTWYGVPKKWTPLIFNGDLTTNGKVALQSYDSKLIAHNRCKKLLIIRNGKPTIGPELESILQLLFGFR